MSLSESLNEYRNALDSAPVRAIKKNKKTFNVRCGKYPEFWTFFENGQWEPNTCKIFDDFAGSDYCCLDIGSWIGPTVLYAAHSAKKVYAFEPDPVACQELKANVNANRDAPWFSRIKVHNKAVAVSGGMIKIGNRNNVGDSMSSVLFADKEASWDVEAVTLNQFLETEQLQNEKLFIKMDIEGGEYDLVPAIQAVLKRPETVLFLSIHPRFLANSLMPGRPGLWIKLQRRLLFIRKHMRLARALPFKYVYRNDGRPVNFFAEMIKAFFTRNFVTEIIALNREWK